MASPDSLKRLRDGMRTRSVTPEQVSIAAALGSDLARSTGLPPVGLPVDYRERILIAVAALPADRAVTFACECAERALTGWTLFHPQEPTPLAAVQATRAWLGGVHDELSLRSASDAASEAAVELDHPDLTEDTDPARCRAIAAANAASHAALAAQEALSGSSSEMNEAAAYAAQFAVEASESRSDEKERQTSHLEALLLGLGPTRR